MEFWCVLQDYDWSILEHLISLPEGDLNKQDGELDLCSWMADIVVDEIKFKDAE